MTSLQTILSRCRHSAMLCSYEPEFKRWACKVFISGREIICGTSQVDLQMAIEFAGGSAMDLLEQNLIKFDR